MKNCNALVIKSKWLLTVREAFPVDCQMILTSILSDGKQVRVVAKDIGDKVAEVGVKVEHIDDKVQVVLDCA